MKIATLALIVRKNTVLLGFRQGKPEIGDGKLNAPGGKIEPGETVLECLVRETQEEVGIELDPRRVEEVAVIIFYAGGVPNFEVHVFRTETFAGEPHETASMCGLYWYPIEDLDDLREDMHESDLRWMPQAIRGRKFRADVFYDRPGEGFRDIKFFPY